MRRSRRSPCAGRRLSIKPSRARPFAVDCRELRWWFAVPELGATASAAWYDPPDWELSSFMTSRTMRAASVHDLDCVEIEVDEWPVAKSSGRGPAQWVMFGRVTDEAVQWLATMRIAEGKRDLYTFLDEGFDEDWGEAPRKLEDRGVYVPQRDGSLKRRRRRATPEATGAGVFRVSVGGSASTCLRVLDVGDAPSETGTLVEAYVNRKGRTVLFRRYNGRLWAVGKGAGYDGPPWDERLPDHQRIVIDGATFVHWYDCVTDAALPAPSADVGG